MSDANVRSINTLTDLKTNLARFGAESRSALQQMEIELRRTQEWLAERKRHWEGQVRRCEDAVRLAQAALERCRSTAYRDPDTGRVYVPDCIGPKSALRQAVSRLQETQAQLANVVRGMSALEEAAAGYKRQAERLTAFTEKGLVEAQVFLERRATALESYVATGLPGLPITTTSPAQAAADTFAAGMVLGALGVTAAAIGVIRWMAGPIRQTLGDAGETLTSQLLSEQFQWHELDFDQPKHGFDRVFRAPGLPVIIIESKVHGQGRFYPGKTKRGEQGSPEWIGDKADKMADPASAQWSHANESIAALIQEIGPENVPVVAVVIETQSGQAAIHYQTTGSNGWQVLDEGISLRDAIEGERGETRG